MSRNVGTLDEDSISHVAQTLEEFLNLDEEDARVYAALLTVNGATLGQISELSGYDVLKVARVLENLTAQRLVTSHGGKFPWYVAAAPYIPATMALLDSSDLVHAQKMLSDVKQKLKQELKETCEDVISKMVKDDDIALFLKEKVLSSLVTSFSHKLEEQLTILDKTLEKNLLRIRTLRLDLERLHRLQKHLASREIVQNWTFPITGEGEMLIAFRDAVQASQRAVRDLILFMPYPDLKSLKMLSTMPDRLTITVILSTLKRIPSSVLKPLKRKEVMFRIRADLDFWGLVRDSEVALFCPVDEDGRVSGIITEDTRLVRLLRGEFLRESTQAKIVSLT